MGNTNSAFGSWGFEGEAAAAATLDARGNAGRTDGRADGESEDSEEDAIVALQPIDRPRPLRPRDVVMDGRTGMRVAAAARRPPKEQSDTRLSPSPGAKTENGEKEEEINVSPRQM